GRLCKAFEACGRCSPAGAVQLCPLGTPKLVPCTDRQLSVTDDETAPAQSGGEANGTARRAAEGAAACHGHRPCCEEAASNACAGRGDVDACQNRALENRSREGHGLLDPPGHVTGVAADHREVGGREGTGATQADFEQPG